MSRVAYPVAVALAVAASGAAATEARDYLVIVGSSTVYPYTLVVAETFAAGGRFRKPEVTATGTGGGFERFCAGSGLDTPDITGASRPMTLAEWDRCRANGVGPIAQVPIGYDGVTVAVARASPDAFALTLTDLYLALAARVPGEGGLVDNPNASWSDVRPELPDVPIRVIGPPKSSGTRDSFVELAMHAGCRADPAMASLEAAFAEAWGDACSTLRTDGAYVEAGEDDEAIVAAIEAEPHTLGILGYGYLFAHEATLRPVAIEGVEPDPVTIASEEYPLSRPLFLYVKTQHEGAVPGMSEFVAEYVRGMNPTGYLLAHGLVPHFDSPDFARLAEDAVEGVPMAAPK